MSNKYIIRNCPSCTKQNDCIAMYLRTSVECKERTDCIMKQIVERCRKEQKYHKEWQKETGFNYAATGLRLAEEILQLIDIQEVE